jgi:AraC family transcriptional regulator
MRSEYAWLAPHEESTTKPHQIGVSFTPHSGLVRESAGRTMRSDVAAGAVFVTGSHGITWTSVAETTEALEIYPDPSLLQRVSRSSDDVPYLMPVMGVRDGVVFGLASVLKWAHVAGRTLTDIEASTVAHRLVEHTVETYREDGPSAVPTRGGKLDRRLVDRIAQYIDAHLAGPITLDQLAAVAALSPFHFARVFRATTGLPPHRFVTARRLEVAKTALLASDASVVEVAHAVGYSNVSHFRRVFHRDLGVLPGELRR